MAFIDEIERELKNVIGPKSKPKVNMNTNNNFTFVGFLIIILVVGAAAAWYVQEGKSQIGLPSPSMQTQSPNYYPPISQPSFQQPNSINQQQQVDALIRQYQLLAQTTQKIYERGQWTQDRMRLMGTVNNHNLAVVQGNLPRSELIYLNEDWTISRLPDRIYLDAETQEFLRKFVRARATVPEPAKS